MERDQFRSEFSERMNIGNGPLALSDFTDETVIVETGPLARHRKGGTRRSDDDKPKGNGPREFFQ